MAVLTCEDTLERQSVMDGVRRGMQERAPRGLPQHVLLRRAELAECALAGEERERLAEEGHVGGDDGADPRDGRTTIPLRRPAVVAIAPVAVLLRCTGVAPSALSRESDARDGKSAIRAPAKSDGRQERAPEADRMAEQLGDERETDDVVALSAPRASRRRAARS